MKFRCSCTEHVLRYPGHFLALLFFSIAFPANGQISPKNNSLVRSTQVMFEAAEQKDANVYEICLYQNENIVQPVLRIKRPSLAFLVDTILQFGNSYQWNYNAFAGNRLLYKSPLFSFTIDKPKRQDLSGYRFNITAGKDAGNSSACIFLDGCGMAINKKGEVKWFINNYDSAEQRDLGFRNINLTPQGTVLYLEQANCFERTLDGNILWQAPKKGLVSNDTVENYHHDCSRMPDGTYLLSSLRFERSPCPSDSSNTCRYTYGTLLQLDKDGKLIWWWNEKSSLDRPALSAMVAKGETNAKSNHLNGFSYDPVTNDFLISFRDNNRVIRVNKLTGKMKYGVMNGDANGISLSGQHSPVFITPGSYLVYNNNLQRGKKAEGGKQNALIYLISDSGNTRLPVKQWEYECRSDSFPDGTVGKEGFAMPLPSGNLLVCMGGGNRLFEITMSKKIVWECFTSTLNSGQWQPYSNYRCHYYSSLFPRYFTVQYQLGNQRSIKINNDGTDTDSYTLTAYNKKGKIGYRYSSPLIKPGASVTVPVAPAKEKFSKIIIQPTGVEGMSRQIILN